MPVSQQAGNGSGRLSAAFRPLDHSRRLTRRAELEIRRKKLSGGSF